MGFYRGANIVTNGLVLALDAANTKSYPGSGTTWSDLSGNENNGTLTNGPSFSSDNGGSIVFDGVDDYSTSSTNITPATGDFTIAFTYKLTGPNGRGGLFERKPSSPYNGFSLGQGGALNWAFSVSGTSDFNNILTVNFSYGSLNTWYIDVGVYQNNNTVIGYRNGNLVGTTTGVNQGNLSTQGSRTNFLIANRDLGSSLPCIVGNVLVYNRALSAAEVEQNYNAYKSRFNL